MTVAELILILEKESKETKILIECYDGSSCEELKKEHITDSWEREINSYDVSSKKERCVMITNYFEK